MSFVEQLRLLVLLRAAITLARTPNAVAWEDEDTLRDYLHEFSTYFAISSATDWELRLLNKYIKIILHFGLGPQGEQP